MGKRAHLRETFPMRNLILLLTLLFVSSPGSSRAGPYSKGKAASPLWGEVDRLAGEQKYQAALDASKKLLESARARKDERLETEAIIKVSQFEMGQHGYETAVRFVKETTWPKDRASRALLHLYYARALVYYQQMYGWEIGKREKSGSTKGDLKAWTTDQIGMEASRSFDAAMSEADSLDGPVPTYFRVVLSPNNYPEGVRPTLRDAVVYLAVEHLANQQFWSAKESNEVYKLPFQKLAGLSGGKRIPAADAQHPVEKIASWLAEHSAAHTAKGRAEAALEARYSLLEKLHSSATEEGDRKTIREALRSLQAKAAKVEWWARGQALLAEFIRAESRPGNLIDARREALAGREAFPRSTGGQFCNAIVFEIERAETNLLGMASDSAGKRSLLVQYRNIRKLHFRAYRLDIDEALRASRGNGFGQLNQEQLQKILLTEPVQRWSTDLAETKDFTLHRHFVTPPVLKTGVYAVVSSLRPEFRESENVVQAVRLNVTDLVLTSHSSSKGEFEIRALSGETGRPIAGASIALHRFNWQTAPVQVKELKTDESGYAVFSEPSRAQNEQNNYFFTGRYKENFASSNENVWFGREGSESVVSSAFVYTDRAIYRPLQKLHFKVLGYQGRTGAGNYEAAKSGTTIQVQLRDPNYQIVATSQVKLGAFGSGSGEFLIPAGRHLGNWQVQTTGVFGGSASVQVEEYKRPTFEPSLKEAAEPLRLNRAAKLSGEARYYFGLPVTSGAVSWRVTREEVAPWWWSYCGWWNPGSQKAAETVASGRAALKADGGFDIEFTPEADERKAKTEKDGISYRFRVEADVTDEGGETRSASRSYRLGFVAVEAKLDWDEGFFRSGQPATLRAMLSDLDGKPLKGSGTWKVARLEGKAELPSELPLDQASESSLPRRRGSKAAGKSADKGDYSFDDDHRRARWETEFRWETVTQGWAEKEAVAEGKVEHNAKGEGLIPLKAFDRAGVYRITYSTKDSFGAKYEASRDFIVGGVNPEINLPLVLLNDGSSRKVGDVARFLVHSGFEKQPLTVEIYRAGKRISRKTIEGGKGQSLVEVPVTREDRGGFTLLVYGLRDHQALRAESSVQVPWKDRELQVEFSSFRDKLKPGQKETFRVTVKNDQGKALEQGAAEVLAYMYDRSLDLFAEHRYPSAASLYPSRTGAPGTSFTLGFASGLSLYYSLPGSPGQPALISDRLEIQASYGIGGPGRRGGYGSFGGMPAASMALMEADSSVSEGAAADGASRAKTAASPAQESGMMLKNEMKKSDSGSAAKQEAAPAGETVRTNFSEQAFFVPHLVTGPNGSLAIEFTAPESVTSWRVLAHAITKDLRGGSVSKETRTVKELMVRPYIPRFLREGDEAEIKVQVNNASEGEMSGELTFEIENLATGKSALKEFGLSGPQTKKFSTAKNGSATFGFPVKAPKTVGDYAFKVLAKSKNFSDGERRPFPMLPSRMHLAQSRFVTLHQKDSKVLEFKDLAAGDDPSLLNEQLVVTVDAQLFYGVLQALPYLVRYPYECVEQTLNRFLSTGIVSSLFDKYPSVGKMAKDFSARKTQLENFEAPDANRRMSLEESPWLQEAKGGKENEDELINVLNPEVAKAERDSAMGKLRKMQLNDGGFPWFQGGPPDEHMTLYLLLGLSRAVEFKVEVPQDLVVKAWGFVRSWLDRHLAEMMSKDYGWETVTMVNFALSSYPNDSWAGGFFDASYKNKLLDFSYLHWKDHAPLVKGYLALTLKRMDREKDAHLVWDSVMDSAKHSEELGTYWAREDRSWLWYNDQIETHAFALRTQMELDQKDKHNEGLVQWLFLNKKLNHWKSTRATGEVIYALTHYLDKTAQLGQKEAVKVELGSLTTEFLFDPARYTGKKNQLVVAGDKIDGKTMSKIKVSKETTGFAFASATWQFSTDKLPKEESGDFFNVTRKYFKREHSGSEWKLSPLTEGTKIRVGDQIEVQLSLRTKHEAEYVHLRDPRGAGFEPETLNSGYKWDLGIFWYEETRDSGSNFFFNRLPVGEYSFKYRLRANMAGTFRVGPATVQSMYAPEFNAYSAGDSLKVEAAKE